MTGPRIPIESGMDDSWREEAACNDMGPEYFYADKDSPEYEFAKIVCGSCAVRAECLDFALVTREKFGIWGGYDERERGRMIRRRQVSAL